MKGEKLDSNQYLFQSIPFQTALEIPTRVKLILGGLQPPVISLDQGTKDLLLETAYSATVVVSGW
jgi:hypothetical protein